MTTIRKYTVGLIILLVILVTSGCSMIQKGPHYFGPHNGGLYYGNDTCGISVSYRLLPYVDPDEQHKPEDYYGTISVVVKF